MQKISTGIRIDFKTIKRELRLLKEAAIFIALTLLAAAAIVFVPLALLFTDAEIAQILGW